MGDMDSGNSGSIQSSSTGGDNDQEYESRDSLSAFFNNNNSASSFAAFENAHSLQLYPYKFNTSSAVFDTQQLPNYFGSSSFQTPNNFIPINNTTGANNTNSVDMSWPGPIRSVSEDAGLASAPHSTGTQQQQQQGNRNPKKRSRASRRAPTTVMTTDTTNFRQMVQEFTGIPASPFSSPSRTRLDLFGFMGHQRTAPSSPLRPFPQKMSRNFQMSQNLLTFQSLLQPSSLSRMSHLGSGHATNNTNTNTTSTATTTADHNRWDGSSLHQGLGLTRHIIDESTQRPEGMLDSWISSSDA